MEDVRLARLQGFEAEGSHRLDQDHDAGHDRRRAIRVKTLHQTPFGLGQLGQQGEDPLAGGQLELVAVYPFRVIGVQRLIDGSERRRGAGDRDSRRRRLADIRGNRAGARSA